MTRHEILDLVGRWQRAIAARDLETYASLYADAAEIHSPLGGSVSGPDGAIKVVRAFFSAFPDATLATEPALVDDHRVAFAATLAGTNTGGLLGLPPSGKPFRFTIVFLLEVQDGLIVRDRRVYDFTGLLVQIGVLKARPA